MSQYSNFVIMTSNHFLLITSFIIIQPSFCQGCADLNMAHSNYCITWNHTYCICECQQLYCDALCSRPTDFITMFACLHAQLWQIFITRPHDVLHYQWISDVIKLLSCFHIDINVCNSVNHQFSYNSCNLWFQSFW